MKRYRPLFMLILVAFLGSGSLSYGLDGHFFLWMHFSMGFLFCQFAMLKLFNPQGFAEGFAKYDLVAKKFSKYSFVYPYIELGLGILYFSLISPILVYILTILVLGMGSLGVIKALRSGLDVRCACMGTVLDVPLSTVTLAEDIGMGLMAFLMLVLSIL